MENLNFLIPKPIVVAHRGDSINYPENTLEAFISAENMNIDIIETDVHLTKDNHIIVYHDSSLERITGKKGDIKDYTLTEIKAFDAGYNFTKDGILYPFRGKGITLCTLREALLTCKNQRFNIDLKQKGEAMVDAFISLITELKAENRVLGASFHLSNLKSLRKKAPTILTSLTTREVIPLLFKQKLKMLPSTFKRKTVFQVPIKQAGIQVITPKFVKDMHKRNATIMVWTVNDEETMKNLFNLGVDSIMTDNPSLVIKVAKELGLR